MIMCPLYSGDSSFKWQLITFLMFLNDDFSEHFLNIPLCVNYSRLSAQLFKQYHQMNINQLCYWTYVSHIFFCLTPLLLDILNNSINWTHICFFLLIPATFFFFVFFFFFFNWHYNPWWVLACFTVLYHNLLCLHFSLQFLLSSSLNLLQLVRAISVLVFLLFFMNMVPIQLVFYSSYRVHSDCMCCPA